MFSAYYDYLKVIKHYFLSKILCGGVCGTYELDPTHELGRHFEPASNFVCLFGITTTNVIFKKYFNFHLFMSRG